MKAIRERMHLPVRSLGRWIGRNEATLRQMEAGIRPIPPDVAEWIERLGRWIEKNDPPKKTR
jgi:hypothetical protein